jgi:ribosomal protein S18 acetylase RimI-like enzyme
MLATLETRAYAAWPAEEIVELAGWRLRFTHGVTRRGNSVWTNLLEGDMSIGARIDRAEAFYGERGLPATFQLSPLSAPADLDSVLARRGYRVDAPVAIQVGRARAIAARTTTLRTRVERSPFEGWFEIAGRRSRFAEAIEVYRALLSRIGARALYALAEVDGQPAAVGLGVLGEAWLGVFSMLTLPEHRRRGAAGATLGALASAALQNGVEQLYLQVERDNGAALTLYRGFGLEEAYGYHYRVAAAQG